MVKDDRTPFRDRYALQGINDSRLFAGELDPFLLHIRSEKESPASAPPSDGQTIGNTADPAFGILIGGQSIPFDPGTDEGLLYEVSGLGGITRERGNLDDEPVAARPVQLIEIAFRIQTASFPQDTRSRALWLHSRPKSFKFLNW